LDEEVVKLKETLKELHRTVTRDADEIRDRLEKRLGRTLIGVGITLIAIILGGIITAAFGPLTKAQDSIIALQKAAIDGNEKVLNVTRELDRAKKKFNDEEAELTNRRTELSKLESEYRTRLRELDALLVKTRQRNSG
jgi:DNA repair exonuclease SbcCD ATPase subunit